MPWIELHHVPERLQQHPSSLGLGPRELSGYNLIVGGESAGSLGAQLHSAHIAKLWDVSSKGTRFSVIADSYVGAAPANHTGSQSLHFTGMCDVDLGMPATVVADCDAETATTIEMTGSLTEEELQGNWLFIKSKGDLTQRYFYALLDEGIEGYPFTDVVSEEDFYAADMSAILDAYQSISSRITTFYVEGTKHVFLADTNFTSYQSDEGLLLGDVLNAWLVSESSLNSNSTYGSTTVTSSSSSSATATPTANSTGSGVSGTSTSSTASTTSTPSTSTTSTSSTSTSSTPLACWGIKDAWIGTQIPRSPGELRT